MRIYIIVKDDGASPEKRGEVDDRIWTNLPDASIANGELRAKVLKYMVHKKCGKHNPSAPCMKVNKNTQEILPEALPSTLHTNDSGRAEYEPL